MPYIQFPNWPALMVWSLGLFLLPAMNAKAALVNYRIIGEVSGVHRAWNARYTDVIPLVGYLPQQSIVSLYPKSSRISMTLKLDSESIVDDDVFGIAYYVDTPTAINVGSQVIELSDLYFEKHTFGSVSITPGKVPIRPQIVLDGSASENANHANAELPVALETISSFERPAVHSFNLSAHGPDPVYGPNFLKIAPQGRIWLTNEKLSHYLSFELISLSAVPEPNTVCLALVVALANVAVARRRA